MPSGMPGRMYVIDTQGKVAYKTARPFGFASARWNRRRDGCSNMREAHRAACAAPVITRAFHAQDRAASHHRLTDPAGNRIYNMTVDEALAGSERLDVASTASSRSSASTARASAPRTIGRRAIIARHDGPILIVAIESVPSAANSLRAGPNQFHPSYTHGPRPPSLPSSGRPDPNPTANRFFTPTPPCQPMSMIGSRYVGAISRSFAGWRVPP